MSKLSPDKILDWEIHLYATGAMKLCFGNEPTHIEPVHPVVTLQTSVYSRMIEFISQAFGNTSKHISRKVVIHDEFIMSFLPRFKLPDGSIHHNCNTINLSLAKNSAHLEFGGSNIYQKGKDIAKILHQVFSQYEVETRPNGFDKTLLFLE